MIYQKLRRIAILCKYNNPFHVLFSHLIGFAKLNKTARYNISGVKLKVRQRSTDLEAAISCLEEGEFDSLSLAYENNTSGIIIDAGAYIGTAAIAFSKMYPNATILALEPSTENYKLLCSNTTAYPNIKPINLALTAQENTNPIKLLNGGRGNWSFTLVQPKDQEYKDIEYVETITIDKLMEEYQAIKLILLKLDIEGAEDELFKHPMWMKYTNIICVELHENNAPGCTKNFYTANKDRYIYTQGGEKFFSIGQSYFKDIKY